MVSVEEFVGKAEKLYELFPYEGSWAVLTHSDLVPILDYLAKEWGFEPEFVLHGTTRVYPKEFMEKLAEVTSA